MSAPQYEWQPTTAEIAAAAGIAESRVERFDHNTSPDPTPWAAPIAARSAAGLNEYPAASYAALREAAAEYHGLDADWVVPGAGIDELILLAGRAFLSPSSRVSLVLPTYPLYAISTAQCGAEATLIPMKAPKFDFPTAAVIEAATTADLIWLCIPNNPTGTRPGPGELRSIIEAARGVVVVDAAYAEFAKDDWTGWIADYGNVVALHTLSKAFGLAGARVGYGIGRPDLVAALDGVRPPGSISSPSVDLAVDALRMPERALRTVAELSERREDLARVLRDFGFRVLPSATNFVLCEVGDDAAGLHGSLLGEGLIARDYPQDSPLAGYLRFTVRTVQAHRRLSEAIARRSGPPSPANGPKAGIEIPEPP